MSLIACLACTRRISHLHRRCPHCGADLHSPEQARIARRERLRRRLLYTRMASYAGISLALLAFLLWWIPDQGRLEPPAAWLEGLFATGLVLYLAGRIQLRRLQIHWRTLG